MNYRITPAEFLNEIGWRFSARGKWLSFKICPFCDGGNSNDVFTFAVHAADGNFFCHRSKCGTRGSFWALIEAQGLNPRDYLGERQAKPRLKKWMYK